MNETNRDRAVADEQQPQVEFGASVPPPPLPPPLPAYSSPSMPGARPRPAGRGWGGRTLTGLVLSAAAFTAGYFGYAFHQDRAFAQSEQRRAEARAGLAHAEDLAAAFRGVGQVMEPSVVRIDAKRKSTNPVSARGGPFGGLDEDLLRRFFPDRDGDGEPDVPEGFRFRELPEMPDGGFESIGTGSGVIMEATEDKGFILTNNHVAGGADEMTITLADGRELKNARVLGADPKTDLAVIEVKAERLRPAVWGDSDQLQKGDWVMAFGSPFGYVGSMTHGIVSALNRQAGILSSIGGYENFIQVDAPINPGNSGGPLVNLKGEVVGINTAIASRSGGFQGVGFSVPSNQARLVYQQLKEKGKVTRGWLGVGIRDVAKNQDLARTFGYEKTNGVLVEQVISNTPATGKLQRGDILTQINGKPVSSVHELRSRIANLPPNTKVTLTVFRDGKEVPVEVTLGEQPDDMAAARLPGSGRGLGRGDQPAPERPTPAAALGVQVRTLTPELVQRHGLGDLKEGAVITRVEPRSPAAREGLRPGDVITEVGDAPVRNAEDLAKAMEKQDIKKGVRLYVVGREGARYVLLRESDR